MVYGYIYRITNIINGKVYIGQSVHVHDRINYHINKLDNNKHTNLYLQLSWDKYGKDNFVFDIIDEADEKYILDNLECFWIAAYGGVNSDMTYNLQDGGSVGKLSKESKNKISESMKKYCKENPRSGENSSMWGKCQSAETRKKQSEAHLGDKNPMKNRTGASNPRAHAVICLETQNVFETITEACEETGALPSKICRCCSGKRRTAANYHWMYCEDWYSISTEEQTNILSNLTYYTHPTGENHPSKRQDVREKIRNSQPNSRAVICLENKKVFKSLAEARRWCNGNVGKCCRGESKTAGGLHWMYYDEYLANEKIDNQQGSSE